MPVDERPWSAMQVAYLEKTSDAAASLAVKSPGGVRDESEPVPVPLLPVVYDLGNELLKGTILKTRINAIAQVVLLCNDISCFPPRRLCVPCEHDRVNVVQMLRSGRINGHAIDLDALTELLMLLISEESVDDDNDYQKRLFIGMRKFTLDVFGKEGPPPVTAGNGHLLQMAEVHIVLSSDGNDMDSNCMMEATFADAPDLVTEIVKFGALINSTHEPSFENVPNIAILRLLCGMMWSKAAKKPWIAETDLALIPLEQPSMIKNLSHQPGYIGYFSKCEKKSDVAFIHEHVASMKKHVGCVMSGYFGIGKINYVHNMHVFTLAHIVHTLSIYKLQTNVM
jgi:hypothetical protein